MGLDTLSEAMSGSILVILLVPKLVSDPDQKAGLLGRAASLSVSNTDREEAYQVGVHSVNAAVSGETSCMVGIKRLSTTPYVVDYILIPLEQIANKVKKFPKEFFNIEKMM